MLLLNKSLVAFLIRYIFLKNFELTNSKNFAIDNLLTAISFDFPSQLTTVYCDTKGVSNRIDRTKQLESRTKSRPLHTSSVQQLTPLKQENELCGRMVEGQPGKLNMTQLMNEVIVIFVVSCLLQGLLYYVGYLWRVRGI